MELEAKTIFEKLGIGGGRQFVVYDEDRAEVPYQLTHDGKLLLQAFVRPASSTELTIVKGLPTDYRFTSWGRVYASREDDLAWETTGTVGGHTVRPSRKADNAFMVSMCLIRMCLIRCSKLSTIAS